ncbi:hypothetical protein AQUCO_00200274v1 [Aquilegia coerulea]|uniref:TTF-type domain-containing protein n=1 Tax=Aquilegia coerulea TaxID=218851 RepID=A0A2G5F2A4_AQUCA|nr:hypothetical protein AQUCO_00200274v1 [Aquilegia coerulea]
MICLTPQKKSINRTFVLASATPPPTILPQTPLPPPSMSPPPGAEPGDIDLCFDVPSSSNPIGVDLLNIVADPGLRKQIKDYHPNERDLIRRAYLLQGLCQPKNHKFPQKLMGKYNRKFKKKWFGRFGSWLEYSIEKDAAFCLYCFLFRLDRRNQGGGKSFVEKRFDNWEKIHKLQKQVGGVNSAHNRAYMMAQNLLIQDQHIETVISRQSDQARSEYRVNLIGVIDVIRFFLRQGLAFRGHDESKTSSNRGNFLELLKYTSDHNEAIKRDDLFAILINEARDVLIKEQMAIVLRYVDTTGSVIERFYGVVHVKDTTLILRENKFAFYVHCFAHQFQLALVTVAMNHEDIALLFNIVSNVVNIVGASCKRLMEAFEKGEIQSGKGLNQETNLKRSGDTRWSSHYSTLLNMIFMFPSVIDVFKDIVEDGRNSEQRGEASALMDQMQSFTFIFSMYLMTSILRITNDFVQDTITDNERYSGWESFLNEVSVVCGKYSVDVPNMEDKFVTRGKSRRGVGEMIETRKNIVYPLVYLLIILALTLPVATASVERAFSAMNIVKNQLRNRMGDQ